MKSIYKRVLIKLSGEALSSPGKTIDYDKLDAVVEALGRISRAGVQMGLVVGGGNIFRGRSSGEMNRTDADHMGMLATVINAVALKDALLRSGVDACVMSAIEMYQVCEPFAQRDAIARLERGQVVIFAAGTGRPYFSTDTAAALRALEIGADALLCGKKCDGVYNKNPDLYPDAVRYDRLTYDEVIAQHLDALDQASIVMCRDYRKGGLPIFCFALREPQNLIDALEGNVTGTYIGA